MRKFVIFPIINKKSQNININKENIKSIEEYQSEMKKILNKNEEELLGMKKNLENYKKLIEDTNKEINIITQKQKQMKNSIDDNSLEINTIKLKQANLQEEKKLLFENNINELEKIKKENLEFKKKIEFLYKKDDVNDNQKKEIFELKKNIENLFEKFKNLELNVDKKNLELTKNIENICKRLKEIEENNEKKNLELKNIITKENLDLKNKISIASERVDKIENLKNEIEYLSERLEEIDYGSQKKQTFEIKKNIENIIERLKRIEDINQKEKNIELNDKIESLSEKIKSLIEYNDKNKEIIDLRNEIKILSERMKEMEGNAQKKNILDINNIIGNFSERLEGFENEDKAQKKNILDLNDIIENLSERLERIEDNNQEENILNIQKEIENLSERLIILENVNHKNEINIELTNKIENLANKLEELENKIEKKEKEEKENKMGVKEKEKEKYDRKSEFTNKLKREASSRYLIEDNSMFKTFTSNFYKPLNTEGDNQSHKNLLSNLEQEKIKEEKPPCNFKFHLTITSDLFNDNYYNNRACIFNYSQDKKIYVVYGVKSLDLECYNVNMNKKFIIKKFLHKQPFNSCRYFYDDLKKKDLILTSSFDQHVKLIEFLKENSQIILDLNFESNTMKIINTAYYLEQYIIVPFSNVKNGKVDFYQIKYGFPWNYHSFVGCISEDAGFILGLSYFYFDKNYKKKKYALIANCQGIFSYCIDTMKFPVLHHKFIPTLSFLENKNNGFDEALVIEKDNNFILIGPCFYYGYLYFWDFFKGDFLYSLKLESGISDIGLWSNNYIFASLTNGASQFILINLNKNKIEKEFKVIDKDAKVCGIKILKNALYGNFIISSSMNGKLDLYFDEF